MEVVPDNGLRHRHSEEADLIDRTETVRRLTVLKTCLKSHLFSLSYPNF